MAYGLESQLQGDTRKFKLSDNIKKYSLRDTGFIETKGGKFQLERSLDPNSPFNQGYKLKIAVEADLKKFKMVTLTANGMREVNIFKGNDEHQNVEQLNFILNDLIEREILVEV
ncbi:hypothetical protein FC40_GL000860 [Ligilactobacillus hayakitensis DSM 18933 = JCM 14209]|uniref:Cysteine desulfurase n=1 Tax=Ligilactobacillus hayakitensis DSM 18933 = JCM 14209 TaxID=1423755 RepID=A0A0R1WMV1_9LACO|nr:DUF1831 domain-containing protein [Ligilactobacillus hayakitensis]KRM19071.1 hypothetical protein FC40_GL000860 [Ligilactobacillus hayakitensis DSM 18933 = JCM 14209]